MPCGDIFCFGCWAFPLETFMAFASHSLGLLIYRSEASVCRTRTLALTDAENSLGLTLLNLNARSHPHRVH